MPDSPAVTFDRLSVTYPRANRPAVGDVDLCIDPGERLLLLGPSGSGKSTLLRAVAGIVPQAVTARLTGSVRVGGRDAVSTPVPELADRVATLTQNPLDQLCLPVVIDELAFALENRCVRPDEIERRVRATARRLGISHLLGRRTATLSGGEGQKVALAASLVADPEILLLDEPTALLDPGGVETVGRTLTTLNADSQGKRRWAVMMIEHRLDEFPWLPERMAMLGEEGTLTLEGPTEKVFRERRDELAKAGAWLPYRWELLSVTGMEPDAALPEIRRRAAASAGSRRRDRGEVVLRASSATVERAGRTVLDGVDLELRAGETLAVVGANGSGKTTLLLGLAGLLPSAGITRGSVGMVFQHPEHQFLTRTVSEEVAYGTRTDDPGPARSLSAFGLDGLADSDPFRLSGGQQRRVSLAAVTVLDREILLADEPTFGQDRRTWQKVAGLLEEQAAAGKALVVATHDLRLAGRLADRVLVLGEGRPLALAGSDKILGDHRLLAAADVPPPPLLRWWRTTDVPLRPLLADLDREAA